MLYQQSDTFGSLRYKDKTKKARDTQSQKKKRKMKEKKTASLKSVASYHFRYKDERIDVQFSMQMKTARSQTEKCPSICEASSTISREKGCFTSRKPSLWKKPRTTQPYERKVKTQES